MRRDREGRHEPAGLRATGGRSSGSAPVGGRPGVRGTIRRVGFGMVAFLLTAMAVSAPTAAPAGEPAHRPLASQGRSGVQVLIDSIGPTPWASENGKLWLSGTVTNQTGAAIPGGLVVQLYWSTQRVADRGQLASSSSRPLSSGPIQEPVKGPVAAGAVAHWSLTLDTARLAPDHGFGVYPVAVVVTDEASRDLGEQRTFVVYVPKNPGISGPKKTRISWVIPLIDRPRRLGNTGSGTFLTDDLEKEFEQGGRLRTLADAGSGVRHAQATWALDPSLLADAADMSKPYQAGAGKNNKRPASTAAQRWLQELENPAIGYFSVPFGDPDVVAMTRARTPLMKDLLAQAIREQALTNTLIGRPATLKLAWPADGAADLRTLNRLAADYNDTGLGVLLSSNQLPAATSSPNTGLSSNGTVRADGQAHPALVFDSAISAAISGDSSTPAGKTLIEQRFLAETAMATANQPGSSPSLVIAPDRHWNPQSGLAAALLNDTTAPWLEPAGLASALAGKPSVHRTLAAYPQPERDRELPRRYLNDVAAGADLAAGLSSIYIPHNGQRRDDYRDGVLRALSSAFRSGSSDGPSYTAALSHKINDTLSRVHILPTRTAALAGRRGPLPFTVVNGLPDTVQVRLEVTSKSPGRLQINNSSQIQIETLRSGGKETIHIPVQATANGYTPIELKIFTLGPRIQMGDTVTTQVHTTGYALLALIITGTGLAVLSTTVGIRAVRSRRRRRQRTLSSTPEPPDRAEQVAED